jgi:hypothetical protein
MSVKCSTGFSFGRCRIDQLGHAAGGLAAYALKDSQAWYDEGAGLAFN